MWSRIGITSKLAECGHVRPCLCLSYSFTIAVLLTASVCSSSSFPNRPATLRANVNHVPIIVGKLRPIAYKTGRQFRAHQRDCVRVCVFVSVQHFRSIDVPYRRVFVALCVRCRNDSCVFFVFEAATTPHGHHHCLFVSPRAESREFEKERKNIVSRCY